MKYIFTQGERLAVAIIINQIEGVNRTDARLISKVDEHLVLSEVQNTGVPIAEMGKAAEFELAELEVEWIKDHINKSFEQQKVPPFVAGSALSLEEKLKADPKEKLEKKAKKKSKTNDSLPEIPPEELLDEEPVPEE